MKVVFLQDVQGTARKGDVKEVAQGYARNFLLPKKLAAVVTPELLKTLDQQAARKEAEAAVSLTQAKQQAEKLKGKKIIFSVKMKQGKLFGSLGPKEIAARLMEEDIHIDQKVIQLKKGLKMVGEYTVRADFGHNIQQEFLVVIQKTE